MLNGPDTNARKGFVGVAVDGTLWGGDAEMMKIMNGFAKKFEVDIKCWGNASEQKIKFLGHDITQGRKTFAIEVGQDHYIRENVKPIEMSTHRKSKPGSTPLTKKEIKQLQARSGTGIWVLGPTRADASVQISMIAGELWREPTNGTTKKFNKAVACLLSRKVVIS